MTATFHLVTGEYPPDSGGVGDYTQAVAAALAARGCDVHVWSPSVSAGRGAGVETHALRDTFGSDARRALGEAMTAAPGCMVLQYVPNALGARGVNLVFCLWLLRLRRQGRDVRVMFHEPYFYFSWNPVGNLRAVVQRAMAATLLRASAVVYISTATWVRYLRPWAPAGSTFVTSPIPSTVARGAGSDRIACWRARFGHGAPDPVVVGHFGTFGDHMARALDDAVPAVLDAVPSARFVCIGRGGDSFAAAIARRHPALRDRVEGTGALPSDEVSAALRACDVVVQPYPDGVTTRRTSVMAALANGVATVTTDGELTEPVWRQTGAVALASAPDPRAIAAAVVTLLRDPGARAALATAGRRTYDERFAIERTIEALLRAPVAGV